MIYFIRAQGTNLIKIGCTESLNGRMSNMQVACPHKLILIKTIDGSYNLEQTFHTRFSEDHIRGEWFNWSPKLQQVIDGIPSGTRNISGLELLMLDTQRLEDVKSNMEREIAQNKFNRTHGKTGMPL
jgi:hypothetical protein